MSYVYNFIASFAMFLEMILSQEYYEYITGNVLQKRLKYFIVLVQFVFMLFYPYLKEAYPVLVNMLFYVLFFCPVFFYRSKFMNKMIGIGVVASILILTEMIMCGIIMIISIVLNHDILFLNDYKLIYSPWYFVFCGIGVVIFLFLLRLIMWFQKKYTFRDFYRIISFPFLQIILIVIFTDFIYSVQSQLMFPYFSIVYWLGFIIVEFLFYKGIQQFKKREAEYIHNKQKKEIINVQMQSLKQIDKSYRELRKENHDFENYCLILLELLEQKETKKAIEYIDMLFKHYDNRREG